MTDDEDEGDAQAPARQPATGAPRRRRRIVAPGPAVYQPTSRWQPIRAGSTTRVARNGSPAVIITISDSEPEGSTSRVARNESPADTITVSDGETEGSMGRFALLKCTYA